MEKKAFIVYFDDQSAVVVLDYSMHSAISRIESESLQKIARVDVVPYKVIM